jgi:hypothetical protein
MKKIKRVFYRIKDGLRLMFGLDKHYVLITLKREALVAFHKGEDADMQIKYRSMLRYHLFQILGQAMDNFSKEEIDSALEEYNSIKTKLEDENN